MNRLKKIAALALALCVLLTLLTGCIRIEIGIDVKKNGKADVSLLYAVSDGLMEDSSAGLSEEDIEEYENEGWSVEPYSKDGYTGYYLKRSDADLTNTELMDGSSGNVRKEGSRYIIDLSVLPESDQLDIRSSASWIKSMGGSFVVRMTLPVKPVAHNATSVSSDGKTLEWDILSMDTDSIHVEFDAGSNVLLYALIAAAAIVIGAVLVFAKNHKQPAPEPIVPGEYNLQEVTPETAPEGPLEEENE